MNKKLIRIKPELVYAVKNLEAAYDEAIALGLDEEDFLILLNQEVYELTFNLIAKTPKKRRTNYG